MITTVTLNPAIDKTIEINSFAIDKVNRVTSIRTDAGGKGINVSKVIAALGGESRVVTIVGGANGTKLANELEQQGLYTKLFFTDSETRINTKVVDPVLHTNTDINESGNPVDDRILLDILDEIKKDLKKDDIIVLAGSLPKDTPRQLYHDWILECKAYGAKIFLDADGDILKNGIDAIPYLVKPNKEELAALCGKSLNTLQEVIDAGNTLMEKGISKVAISLGSKGALLLSAEGVIHSEGLKVPVSSTVGAGDSMVAALAYGEECGMEISEAFRMAIAVSAASVMCPGTQSAKLDVIKELLPKVNLRYL